MDTHGTYDIVGIVAKDRSHILSCARHKPTGKLLVVKSFEGDASDALLETTLLKELQGHPNICSVLEVWRSPSRVFLLLENISTTVLNRLKGHSNGLPVPEVKSLAAQMANVLTHIHSKQLVYGGLKLENLLLSPENTLKVVDMQYARQLEGLRVGPSAPSSTMRWYCAPELLVGDRSGTAADIWALGCVLVELLTGRPLFPGRNEVETLIFIAKGCGGLSPRHISVLKGKQGFNEVMHALSDLDPAAEWPLQSRLGAPLRKDKVLLELVRACLQLEPTGRPTAQQVLQHPALREAAVATSAATAAAATGGTLQPAPPSGPRSVAIRSRSSFKNTPTEAASTSSESSGGPSPASAHAVKALLQGLTGVIRLKITDPRALDPNLDIRRYMESKGSTSSSPAGTLQKQPVAAGSAGSGGDPGVDLANVAGRSVAPEPGAAAQQWHRVQSSNEPHSPASSGSTILSDSENTGASVRGYSTQKSQSRLAVASGLLAADAAEHGAASLSHPQHPGGGAAYEHGDEDEDVDLAWFAATGSVRSVRSRSGAGSGAGAAISDDGSGSGSRTSPDLQLHAASQATWHAADAAAGRFRSPIRSRAVSMGGMGAASGSSAAETWALDSGEARGLSRESSFGALHHEPSWMGGFKVLSVTSGHASPCLSARPSMDGSGGRPPVPEPALQGPEMLLRRLRGEDSEEQQQQQASRSPLPSEAGSSLLSLLTPGHASLHGALTTGVLSGNVFAHPQSGPGTQSPVSTGVRGPVRASTSGRNLLQDGSSPFAWRSCTGEGGSESPRISPNLPMTLQQRLSLIHRPSDPGPGASPVKALGSPVVGYPGSSAGAGPGSGPIAAGQQPLPRRESLTGGTTAARLYGVSSVGGAGGVGGRLESGGPVAAQLVLQSRISTGSVGSPVQYTSAFGSGNASPTCAIPGGLAATGAVGSPINILNAARILNRNISQGSLSTAAPAAPRQLQASSSQREGASKKLQASRGGASTQLQTSSSM